MLLYRSAVMLLFQSTLPREERPYPLVSYLINLLFQSTLPREERLCQRIINMVLGYFNPRSHERSDKPFIYKALRTIISIHAPTRGATQLSPHPKTLSHFNPRSHERSDAPKWDIDFTIPDFNPRSHERSDECKKSIRLLKVYFNPRSHERSDLFCFMRFAISSGISIHAPTRGATSISTSQTRPLQNFNPRSHERSDPF